MAVLTIAVARCSCRASRNSGLTAPIRHPAGPGCSTARLGELDCPAITHQCVPSSTARHRPERRSDDGQMISEALPAAREPGPDLGFRGAPLRNRTVDLLLTMQRRASTLDRLDRSDGRTGRRGSLAIGSHVCRSLVASVRPVRDLKHVVEYKAFPPLE